MMLNIPDCVSDTVTAKLLRKIINYGKCLF